MTGLWVWSWGHILINTEMDFAGGMVYFDISSIALAFPTSAVTTSRSGNSNSIQFVPTII